MTLPKPAFLLPAQPFYPTLRSHGSGTDISLTDIMNFPSVHVEDLFFLSEPVYVGSSFTACSPCSKGKVKILQLKKKI